LLLNLVKLQLISKQSILYKNVCTNLTKLTKQKNSELNKNLAKKSWTNQQAISNNGTYLNKEKQ
jgi:hypothetical protein